MKNTYWKKTKTRENLILFYNELNEAIVEAGNREIESKRKWTQTKAKKACKPILDRWEKVFDGAIAAYNFTIKMPTKFIKKATE